MNHLMMYPQMEGRLVFKNAVERMITVMMETFQKHNLTLDDVDLFCFHQANLRINQYIQEQIGAPRPQRPQPNQSRPHPSQRRRNQRSPGWAVPTIAGPS